ncbi:hypothetical protein GCM10011583_30790 [Streptomyces camponoticapitis]|uniref:Uncharacterized protein n=1 Tax=Streptomyces camponoticapitis TaxID=1616125 RepID=A0ABQ2E5M0_9ACTN|nr:RRQRL motif-containing zinc-binding protein [Streptomyces camponoticapitis]GGJ97104.1 hypothetical protein GCM10011583_30790 [Streptomyces camponoticapitis]
MFRIRWLSDSANPLVSTFPWKYATAGYATRRQLRARGLRPARSRSPHTGVAVAHLYRIDHAKPVRPMTPGLAARLAKAVLARRTCPNCRTDAVYCIPPSPGMCVPCAYPPEELGG